VLCWSCCQQLSKRKKNEWISRLIWLTRVNPGQPIKPETRPLGLVNSRAGFNNFGLNVLKFRYMFFLFFSSFFVFFPKIIFFFFLFFSFFHFCVFFSKLSLLILFFYYWTGWEFSFIVFFLWNIDDCYSVYPHGFLFCYSVSHMFFFLKLSLSNLFF
jgi:hypothetical protein